MRYIDADALIERLKFKRDVTDIGRKKNSGLECAIAQVQKQPTADVVPKSEVARLQEDVDRLQEINNRQVENIKLAKAEVAREIFEEIDAIFLKNYNKSSEPTELKLLEPLCQAERFIINEMWHDVAELKKKYQEGERNGSK